MVIVANPGYAVLWPRPFSKYFNEHQPIQDEPLNMTRLRGSSIGNPDFLFTSWKAQEESECMPPGSVFFCVHFVFPSALESSNSTQEIPARKRNPRPPIQTAALSFRVYT